MVLQVELHFIIIIMEQKLFYPVTKNNGIKYGSYYLLQIKFITPGMIKNIFSRKSQARVGL